MHAVAYWALLLGLFVSLFAGAFAVWLGVWDRKPAGAASRHAWLELLHYGVTALVVIASAILLYAFVTRDFSNVYVSEYSDSVLPLFYTITAFWAGQDGSLLFWGLVVAVLGAIFPFTPGYRRLPSSTRTLYWALFFAVQAFFLLLLTNWSNPFRQVLPAPADGRGLNPLLQNPGMIFHPPLLFIGYAGFTIPACLAVASMASGDRFRWLNVGRTWLLVSWAFLSAGIILGGWWSYMELGWGGYWAWDPVENASLIPWLSSTALLHTAIIEERRKGLYATNVFLVGLTLVLCFFGTYLVRSGVIDSLHAFGGGGVARPLLLTILGGLALTGLVIWLGEKPESRQLSGMLSRTGFLVVAAWAFLALGLVVFLGTMWPVISKLWSANPVGFDAGFYNRVCLPLFALIALLLVACPWLGWRGGLAKPRLGAFVLVVFAAAMAVAAWAGVVKPLAMAGVGAGAAVTAGMIALPFFDSGVRRYRPSWGFVGVHLGLGLMVLGVAVSGPYQQTHDVVLDKGQTYELGDYSFRYEDMETGQNPAMAWVKARMQVTRDGKVIGELGPERRLYRNFEQPFAEVAVIPSLGNELYAVLLGISQDGRASMKLAVNPLVNWIWIGGTIMCLAVFLCVRSKLRSEA